MHTGTKHTYCVLARCGENTRHAERGRSAPADVHAEPPSVVSRSANTATPLPSERAYLRLDRATHDHRVTSAVAQVSALDARLLDTPRDVTSSPVQAGETHHFVDPYREGRVSYVHRLVGGQEVIVIIPLRADSSDVANAVDVLVDTVLAALP